MGGAGGDQPDRDRLRHEPQRLHRGGGRLDAVPPLDLGRVRGRRQRGQPQGPLQPGRRDLRRGALPEGRRRRERPADRRSSPTTTPTGTWTRCCSTPASTASSPRIWSARSSASPTAPGSRSPPRPATRTTSPSARRPSAPSPARAQSGNVADVVTSSPTRRGINIYSRKDAPVVAVNDGTIKRIGHNSKLGNYVVLQDSYGNRFTYAQLGPRLEGLPGAEAATSSRPPTSSSSPRRRTRRPPAARDPRQAAGRQRHQGQRRPASTPRTCASGSTPCRSARTTSTAPTSPASSTSSCPRSSPATETFKSYFGGVLHFNRDSMELRALRKGSQVVAGTVLGRIGKTGQARAARQLRHQAGRARRPEDRSQADPGRLEAARGDRDLSRRRQEPVLVLERERHPDPADAEDAARAPGARRPAPVDLRVRPRRHPHRPDRPAGPGVDGVPRGQRLQADRHLAEVRPQRLHVRGQHQRALDRRRDGHRRDQRDPDPRQPGPGLDHRGGGRDHCCGSRARCSRTS